jgi:hypothetical protein
METYGLPDETWRAAKKEIRALLVTAARRRQLVPYSDVTAQLTSYSFDPDDPRFHSLLDAVSTEEDERGRGLLTVVVVHKTGDMRPGPGFFDLARDRGRSTTEIEKTWAEELARVQKYWSKH